MNAPKIKVLYKELSAFQKKNKISVVREYFAEKGYLENVDVLYEIKAGVRGRDAYKASGLLLSIVSMATALASLILSLVNLFGDFITCNYVKCVAFAIVLVLFAVIVCFLFKIRNVVRHSEWEDYISVVIDEMIEDAKHKKIKKGE